MRRETYEAICHMAEVAYGEGPGIDPFNGWVPADQMDFVDGLSAAYLEVLAEVGSAEVLAFVVDAIRRGYERGRAEERAAQAKARLHRITQKP